ncbi:meiosis expressed gene 1 protein homolog [Striga asiatica]|uniref:Meiosis expressed gene 1 protein homolog n=1 Tax=Striga asiatica TaxID=4170 RepID=A0A5A7QR43_STRAF|nr:meiosis expressed gene 1 protein homolog [Striga asiatica]
MLPWSVPVGPRSKRAGPSSVTEGNFSVMVAATAALEAEKVRRKMMMGIRMRRGVDTWQPWEGKGKGLRKMERPSSVKGIGNWPRQSGGWRIYIKKLRRQSNSMWWSWRNKECSLQRIWKFRE